MNQEDREWKDVDYWIKLKELADKNNITSFYKLYAEYLEWQNIISDRRKILHKMAQAVGETK